MVRRLWLGVERPGGDGRDRPRQLGLDPARADVIVNGVYGSPTGRSRARVRGVGATSSSAIDGREVHRSWRALRLPHRRPAPPGRQGQFVNPPVRRRPPPSSGPPRRTAAGGRRPATARGSPGRHPLAGSHGWRQPVAGAGRRAGASRSHASRRDRCWRNRAQQRRRRGIGARAGRPACASINRQEPWPVRRRCCGRKLDGPATVGWRISHLEQRTSAASTSSSRDERFAVRGGRARRRGPPPAGRPAAPRVSLE